MGLAAKKTPDKYCKHCGTKFNRKRVGKSNQLECYSNYMRRKFCSLSCSVSNQHTREGHTIEEGEWMPFRCTYHRLLSCTDIPRHRNTHRYIHGTTTKGTRKEGKVDLLLKAAKKAGILKHWSEADEGAAFDIWVSRENVNHSWKAEQERKKLRNSPTDPGTVDADPGTVDAGPGIVAAEKKGTPESLQNLRPQRGIRAIAK